MSKWDQRFIDLAMLVSSWSKDESTQVGAVIVDQEQRIVSTGFNGQPRGCIDFAGLPRETRLKRTVHAEQNALLFSRQSVKGCTIYVTAPPCSTCACMLVQAGIKRIVALEPPAAFASRWADDMHEAERMYAEAGVTLTLV